MTKNCRNCDAPFEQPAKVRAQLYCSNQCARRYGSRKHYHRSKEGLPPRPCESCGGPLPRAATRWCHEAKCEKARVVAARELTRIRNKERRATDPEFRARSDAALRAWNAANPERKRQIDRESKTRRRDARLQRYRTDPEYRARIQANNEKWKFANPDRKNELDYLAVKRRRARKRAATISPFTAEQLAARLSMYAGCWICGDPRWTEADHVKPLAKGGPHMLANLRPACGTCNRRKGSTWPFDLTRGL